LGELILLSLYHSAFLSGLTGSAEMKVGVLLACSWEVIEALN
jgi:hypothetical protein